MKALNAMIKDEKSAPKGYYKLMKGLPIKERASIKNIIKDERSHLLTLKNMKRRLNK